MRSLIEVPAWHRIEPQWQSPADILDHGRPFSLLSPSWKLLLLSDGSVTRHLQVLTSQAIEVDVISMALTADDLDSAPAFLELIPGPRLRRQVWLRTVSGQRLAYAASWWEASRIDQHIKVKSLPIWASLAAQKAELYREIRLLQLGHSAALADAFGCQGPFWGRYYFFWNQQQPLTLIYEVFSPELQRFL